MISDSKIEYLDSAFNGTAESQGYKNAKLAIKYVLFDDENSIDKKLQNGDKWKFISSKYNGRELAKKLHHMDLMHILIKFSYVYFAKLNIPFKLDQEKYLELKNSLFPSIASTINEQIELVVYASLISVGEAYIFLSTHKDVVMNILDLFISERYLNHKQEEYNNFEGIPYPKMKIAEYEYFIDKYNNLDIEFSLLKRKSPDYINE